MRAPSSRVSHQACLFELDPGELSSNGILGNRGLIHVGPLDLKAHAPRKGQLYSGVARYFKESPADRESDSALAELLSGKHTC